MKQAHMKLLGAGAVGAVLAMAAAFPAFAQTSLNVAANANGGPINAAANANAAVSAKAGWPDRGPDGGPGMGGGKNGMGNRAMQPGIFGTVKAVNSAVITVESRGFGKNTASTTYSVDASSAVVMKNNATSTLSSVAVGDTIFAQGTVSGTSVAAKTIRDGMMMRRGPGAPGMKNDQASPMAGNGQPVVAGTVSSVNGNMIAITTSSNTSYTIDASSAKITSKGSAATVSSVSVGDYVVVQGAVNGTAVTAASVMDSKSAPASGNPGAQRDGGFMSSIGNFFKHLFGF